jgi:hypothetical protein
MGLLKSSKERQEFLDHLENRMKLFKMKNLGVKSLDDKTIRPGDQVQVDCQVGKVLTTDSLWTEIETQSGTIFEYTFSLRKL